jgi:hypothetical protein
MFEKFNNKSQEKGTFINLLPSEIQKMLLSFLLIKDWHSLALVNKQCRDIVSQSANFYHESIQEQLKPILSFNFDKLMDTLHENVSAYKKTKLNPLSYADDALILSIIVKDLKHPLAKLLYCEKKVKELIGLVQMKYVAFFNERPKSQLDQILQSVKIQCKLFSDHQWFQQAKQCAGLTTLPNPFLDAFLEIKELANKVENTSFVRQGL